MQAPRAVEKKAEVVWHHLFAVEQMGKCGTLCPRRVRPLKRLVELLRIAEQHKVGGARRGGNSVGQGHLAGLVDEEHVDAPDHVVSRPKPGSATDHVERAVVEAVAVPRRGS